MCVFSWLARGLQVHSSIPPAGLTCDGHDRKPRIPIIAHPTLPATRTWVRQSVLPQAFGVRSFFGWRLTFTEGQSWRGLMSSCHVPFHSKPTLSLLLLSHMCAHPYAFSGRRKRMQQYDVSSWWIADLSEFQISARDSPAASRLHNSMITRCGN